jgi:hypothetical protein
VVPGYFFLGTLAPFFRASESPIAIACLRLFTLPPLPPLPERSVPFFFLCIALSTDLPAALPYLRPIDFSFELERFLVAIVPPLFNEKHGRTNELRPAAAVIEHESQAAQTSCDLHHSLPEKEETFKPTAGTMNRQEE